MPGESAGAVSEGADTVNVSVDLSNRNLTELPMNEIPKNVTELDAGGNRIEDLSALSGLTKLAKLNLAGTESVIWGHCRN
jgi:Leucine-rich repeat (LRR) protein